MRGDDAHKLVQLRGLLAHLEHDLLAVSIIASDMAKHGNLAKADEDTCWRTAVRLKTLRKFIRTGR